jgi:uncharacterized protein YbjT (DUF2867 family)
MAEKMRILILGATGRTGKILLNQALERGYKVNILVRDVRKLTLGNPNLLVFETKLFKEAEIAEAMQGCNAVISTLNISRINDFPWSPLRTPIDFLSRTLGKVVKVCRNQGVKRLVFTSAWGVGNSRQHVPAWFRWFVDNSNIGPAYADHAIQEEIATNSGLDWTAVRPVGLINSNTLKPAKVSFNNQPKPGLILSRKSLTSFILRIVESGEFIGESPTVYS